MTLNAQIIPLVPNIITTSDVEISQTRVTNLLANIGALHWGPGDTRIRGSQGNIIRSVQWQE